MKGFVSENTQGEAKRFNILYRINICVSFHRDENEMVLNFKMNLKNIVVLRRHRLLNSFDFVSCVGGLVGLFTGQKTAMLELLIDKTLNYFFRH